MKSQLEADDVFSLLIEFIGGIKPLSDVLAPQVVEFDGLQEYDAIDLTTMTETSNNC